MASTEFWAAIGSVLAFILGLISLVLKYHETFTLWMNKIQAYLRPYIQITIPEYAAAGRVGRNEFYNAIEAYLYEHCGAGVRKLTAELGSITETKPTFVFYVDAGQQIVDSYAVASSGGSDGDRGSGHHDGDDDGNHGDGRGDSRGGTDGDRGSGQGDGHGDRSNGRGDRATVWWHAYTTQPEPGEKERRFYRVSFHRRFRELVVDKYLPHVMEQGRDAIAKKRQLRLFTNSPDSSWSYAAFKHPADFEKLAMEPMRKQRIMKDLDTFRNSKDYYIKIGKPWKRGYLLFGPPGTGKSTMVSAMAKRLEYDIYDLELTAVRSNNQLRRLFIQTTEKSIIVIEDIDRSVDLTDGRNKKGVVILQPTTTENKNHNAGNDGFQQLTLSGLLNFIDGLWSACGSERIIVFTTNNKDKLDPALIRPGRMDMHIEMSYCTFEAFKVLARNYLGITDRNQFGKIQELLKPEKAKITPADVAEHLMHTEKGVDERLDDLMETLEKKVNDSKAIVKKRDRHLFTNNPNRSWSSVAFQHPADFDKLAMEPTLKKKIMNDLDTFRKSKDYYAKIGKPWKRGYLLFGPPGTGKSTMVSAMANYMDYDVYDLELTAVRSNNQLRYLFIETREKSIIVIEDIDSSADLTGGRNKKKGVVNVQPTTTEEDDAENDGFQQLTLSGLLNFIDGLWWACGGERIIVFTTNNKDMLDPALIRRGRMDMHIEMSYCSFEAFKVLASNYLGIINETHMYGQYGEIQRLLEQEKAEITPADVAEHLMHTEKDVSERLDDLVNTLKDKVAKQ